MEEMIGNEEGHALATEIGTGEVVGHFVIVRVTGIKGNTQLDSIVGVFHNRFHAQKYADLDVGLVMIETETLG